MAEKDFESWHREEARATVKHYHSDNGVFTAALFKEACDKDGQTQSFSGVGAQHQNSEAERSIQTVVCMARSFMTHAALIWGQHGATDTKLWSLALDHAGWLYNQITQRRSGITPLEFVTKYKANHVDLARTHVWGYSCYVLDAKLQNNHKLPK